MNPNEITELDKELEKLAEAYRQQIIKLANKVFEKDIKPYLVENKLSMVSGNGDYWISRRVNGEPEILDAEDLPQHIRTILDTYVDRNSSLGEWMPQFEYKD
jgi:hypothetical protein